MRERGIRERASPYGELESWREPKGLAQYTFVFITVILKNEERESWGSLIAS